MTGLTLLIKKLFMHSPTFTFQKLSTLQLFRDQKHLNYPIKTLTMLPHILWLYYWAFLDWTYRLAPFIFIVKASVYIFTLFKGESKLIFQSSVELKVYFLYSLFFSEMFLFIQWKSMIAKSFQISSFVLHGFGTTLGWVYFLSLLNHPFKHN